MIMYEGEEQCAHCGTDPIMVNEITGKLERERDEARAQVERKQKDVDDGNAICRDVMAERDVLEINYKAAMGTVNDYAKECHELRAQVERLREALHHSLQCWSVDGVTPEHGSVFQESDSRCDEHPAQSLAEHDAALLERFAGGMEMKALYVGGDAPGGVLWACQKARARADRIRHEAGL